MTKSKNIAMSLMMNRVQRVPYYQALSRSHQFELAFFDQQGINWEEQSIVGLHLANGQWTEACFSFPKTIYNRCYPGSAKIIEKLGKLIGPQNIFNTLTQFDKWNVYQLLVQGDLAEYLPQTYQYTSDQLEQLIEEHTTLILKPRLGFGGAGVLKINKTSDDSITVDSHWSFSIPLVGKSLYLLLLTTMAPPANFIGQQYIDSIQNEEHKFDIRVIMQKNFKGEWEVAGQLSRVTEAKVLLTNNYVKILHPHNLVSDFLISTMHYLAHLVARQLDGKLGNLGEISVDFLVDQRDEKPWILEVNGKPDKMLVKQLADGAMLERVYLNPLDYQGFLVEQKSIK